MKGLKVTFDSNALDYAGWIAGVPEKMQNDIDRKIPTVARGSKREVKNHLIPGHGVDEGVYRKSFIINNFSEKKWHVGFQVFAKKPHYRLTHLLESYENRPGGHRIFLFTPGVGRQTKWGNIGMSWVRSAGNNGWTRKIEHIEPGQKYAEQKLIDMYEITINARLSERMKKIK